jgi:hypothetical protein
VRVDLALIVGISSLSLEENEAKNNSKLRKLHDIGLKTMIIDT